MRSNEIKEFTHRQLALRSGSLVLLVLVLSVSNCQPRPALGDRHVNVLPSKSELVGRWTIDQASLERIKGEQSRYPMSKVELGDHLIVLREDGSCSFKTYSSFQFDRDYVVAEGKWELVLDQPDAAEGKRAALRLTLKPNSNDQVVAQFWIGRENSALVLWQHIGDPDHSRYADFHKQP